MRRFLIFLSLVSVAIPASAIDLEYRSKKLNRGTYKNTGPLGMPSYRFPLTVEFDTHPNKLAPELQACIWLYQIHMLAVQGEKDGPSETDEKDSHCKLVRVVKAPKWTLGPVIEQEVWGGSAYPIYQYSPVRVGRDQMRFVLQYGADQIDCTADIKVIPFEP